MYKSMPKDNISFNLRGKLYEISIYDKDTGTGVLFNAGGITYKVEGKEVFQLLTMLNKRSELEADIQTLEAQMFEVLQEGFFKPELHKVYKERNELKDKLDSDEKTAVNVNGTEVVSKENKTRCFFK